MLCCFCWCFLRILGVFFFCIGILYHCSRDTGNTFWDMLSLIAVVTAAELQGGWVSCPAGWCCTPFVQMGNPAGNDPELLPTLNFLPREGLVWCQCLLMAVGGNREQRNLMLGNFLCYREDLATECTQTAPESGKMDTAIQIQAWAWF